MRINQKSLSFLVGAFLLLLVVPHGSAERAQQKADDKQMESFLPFLFMMGGGAPLHGAAAFMVGTLSLFAMAALGVDKFLLRGMIPHGLHRLL